MLVLRDFGFVGLLFYGVICLSLSFWFSGFIVFILVLVF